MYPARYPEVIAVAASDFNGSSAQFSNLDQYTDLMAPGSEVISLDITNGASKVGFGSCSGTSMAAPHVTAAVVMMKALDPLLGPDKVQQILLETADHGSGAPVGEINLSRALERVMTDLIGTDSRKTDRD